MPIVSHEETTAVHCGPGPFSMAGPDMVSEMLKVTGWERISFERFDRDISIGRDIDEAIQFAMAYGPAGEIFVLQKTTGKSVFHSSWRHYARYLQNTCAKMAVSGLHPVRGSFPLTILE